MPEDFQIGWFDENGKVLKGSSLARARKEFIREIIGTGIWEALYETEKQTRASKKYNARMKKERKEINGRI